MAVLAQLYFTGRKSLRRQATRREWQGASPGGAPAAAVPWSPWVLLCRASRNK